MAKTITPREVAASRIKHDGFEAARSNTIFFVEDAARRFNGEDRDAARVEWTKELTILRAIMSFRGQLG